MQGRKLALVGVVVLMVCVTPILARVSVLPACVSPRSRFAAQVLQQQQRARQRCGSSAAPAAAAKQVDHSKTRELRTTAFDQLITPTNAAAQEEGPPAGLPHPQGRPRRAGLLPRQAARVDRVGRRHQRLPGGGRLGRRRQGEEHLGHLCEFRLSLGWLRWECALWIGGDCRGSWPATIWHDCLRADDVRPTPTQQTPQSQKGGETAFNMTGNVANDFYNRWREDVAMMKKLGVKTYRCVSENFLGVLIGEASVSLITTTTAAAAAAAAAAAWLPS